MSLWLLLFLTFSPADASFVDGMERRPGFFDVFWDAGKGETYLLIKDLEDPFLLVNSIPTGLGSNDIGLDRGQLGDNRVVYWRRVGPSVFLIEPNQTYRANSDNAEERKAIAQSFAYSTLWSAKIEAEMEDGVLVALSSLAFRDEQGVVKRLRDMKEGSYQVDRSRTHFVPEFIKSFPDNTEVTSALTFTGNPTGRYTPTVAPTASAFTLQQRFSFVRLPDNDYKPRLYHANSGGFFLRYRDYAAPLDAPVEQRFLRRHHLKRKNPGAKKSELVEPLVFYVDRGAPPQIQQALIEGAMWWNEAFEAAGIVDGYRVEIMPEGADPMDVRYNTIQWVHRSTRGWSYGASVWDPRTGEMIKGHVTLGSLRVRQDRLLFEGMLPHDGEGNYADEYAKNPVKLALARIRQLSAHEVGHTIGAAHNFAASSNDRSSVMDYPAPLVLLKDGEIDLSQAYDTGIGEWDKQMIRYLYGEFDDEAAGLEAVLRETEEAGMIFIDDFDGRSTSTMHPQASVWDNGADAVDEMERVIEVRNHILQNFGPQNLHPDRYLSQLEDVLTPVYLHHRFQLAACAKSLGGAWFDYGKNDGRVHYRPVTPEKQQQAMKALLQTLKPQFLDLPDHLQNLIPPRASGYRNDREAFERRTWPGFDPLALAETGAQMTLDAMFSTQRINRLYNQSVLDDKQPGPLTLIDALLEETVEASPLDGRLGAIHRLVNYKVIEALLTVVADVNIREDVRAMTAARLTDLGEDLEERETADEAYDHHYQWLIGRIEAQVDEEEIYVPSSKLRVPPGSPIGTESHNH